jgi:hypothetical protein
MRGKELAYFSIFTDQAFSDYAITLRTLFSKKNVAEGMHTCIVCYVPTIIIHYYMEFMFPKNTIATLKGPNGDNDQYAISTVNQYSMLKMKLALKNNHEQNI